MRNFFCRLDVTQKEIADRSGYCTAYFSRIMNGISAPNSLEVLERLAHALELNDKEKLTLINASRISQKCLHLPSGLTAEAFTVAHLLNEVIKDLDQQKLAQIESICRSSKYEEKIMQG